MDAISVIAWIVIIYSLIKTLFVFFSPKSWMNFAKEIWKIPQLTSIIFLALAGIILYYLISSGISIIQIFAVMAFTICIFALSMSSYMKEFIPAAQKIVLSKDLVRRGWLTFIVWFALVIWAVIELTAQL